MSAAVLNGLPDGFLAKTFARVNGNVEILPLNVVKRVHMLLRRISALFTGQVKSHDSTLTKIHSKLGHLERHIHVAHRANDQARRDSKVLSPLLQALQHSGNHLLMSQSVSSVKQGSEPRLEIDHSVSAQILCLLIGNSFERLFALHHRNCVCKSFQVLRQASLIRALVEPARELLGIFAGKLLIPGPSCQVDYGSWPEHAVKVFVQQYFGNSLQYAAIQFHGALRRPCLLRLLSRERTALKCEVNPSERGFAERSAGLKFDSNFKLRLICVCRAMPIDLSTFPSPKGQL